jgi:hypothetical protein
MTTTKAKRNSGAAGNCYRTDCGVKALMSQCCPRLSRHLLEFQAADDYLEEAEQLRRSQIPKSGFSKKLRKAPRKAQYALCCANDFRKTISERFPPTRTENRRYAQMSNRYHSLKR